MELDQKRFRSEYLLESASKTLQVGTLFSWLSLPVITGFALQDIYVLHLNNVWIWRIIGILPFVLFLGYRYLVDNKSPVWIIRLNMFNLFGVVSMMAGIAYVVLADPQASLLNQYGVSAGLITTLFISLIVAGSSRKALYWILPSILAILTIALLFIPAFDAARLGFLSNAYLVCILVLAFTRMQEKAQFRDFYHRKLIETREVQLSEQKGQLEAVNKDLESFSYTVSHDLRGPLRNLMGLSKILKRNYLSTEAEETKIADAILFNSKKMNQLVDDILEFSRAGKKSLKHDPLDMTAMFQEVYDELRPQEPDREIHFHLEPLPQANGDPSLMRQVVTNLLSNALKYTRKKEVAKIWIQAEAKANHALYWIKDNGAGFNSNEKDKLFLAFQRLHNDHEFEGNGVGLAFVHKVIQRHEGKIWANAQPDQGATFYFTLPMQVPSMLTNSVEV